MYTLTFTRSKSKFFQKALNHLITMGGSWDGETARLDIPSPRIPGAYEELVTLFQYVGKWESLKATFEGRPVKPYRFIFLVWHNVHQCSERKELSFDQRHCWHGTDVKGWGCKHLQRFSRYSEGPARYKTSNRYWYNFGEFTDPETWKVNKDLILQRIREEVQEKALHLCPFFSMEEVIDIVADLPDFIRVDGFGFKPYYRYEYVDGEKRPVPVNIRHVPPPKEIASMQDIINNDPGKYQWN